MVLNSAVMKSLSKADKKWLVAVLDLNLVTREYTSKIPKSRKVTSFECHTICRAIARHIKELKVVDGHYTGVSQKHKDGKWFAELKFCTHSWLATPSGSIIDPYPVGFLSVNSVLVVNRGRYKNFGGGLYWPDPKVTEKINTPELRQKVKILSQIIRAAQKDHRAKNS